MILNTITTIKMKDKVYNMTKYKIKNILYGFLCIVMLTMGLYSCVDDYLRQYSETTYDGEEVTVPISLSVIPMESMDAETRAIKNIEASEDEKKIHDFWIIEYHENGWRVGLPRYYSIEGKNGENDNNLPKDIKILVPRDQDSTFTCVMIANTNDKDLFSREKSAHFSHLDSLRQYSTSAHNQEMIFNPAGGKYLLMSGWTTISKPTESQTEPQELSFKLMRNVCKVNVKLTDFPEANNPEEKIIFKDLLFKYFQWRDVPLGKVFPHGKVDYHQPKSRDWRQHDKPEDYKNLRSEKGIDFYLPGNIWLPDGPLVKDEDKNVPDESYKNEDPTRFTIVCRDIERGSYTEEVVGLDSLGKPISDFVGDDKSIVSVDQYELCLYPSMAVDKQFEFKLNHFYQLEMSINGLPSEDNPFCNIIKPKILEESNCYMIRRDTKVNYAVPLTRINKFWGNEGGEDGFEPMDSTTKWVAEVIWQDTPTRIIDFASYAGFEASQDLDYLEGCGETCFAFRPTGNGEGNVIVGVRKKVDGWKDIPVEEREYLWSWHLWITDYAPDEFKEEGPYNWYYKEVPGGAVHRYPAIEYWDTDGAEQYIMDRDLGAKYTFDKTDVLDDMSPHIYAGECDYRFWDVYPTFGLYYQYGRKDPFPYSEGAYPDNLKDDAERLYPKEGIQMIYDINGNKISAFSKHTTMLISEPNVGSFENAVKHPYVFYTISPGARFWHDPTVGADVEVEPWLAPAWGDLDTGKSIYDPCPPGWRLIPNITVYGSWADATLQNRVHHYMVSSSFNVGTCIELGDGHNAFYPASGRRDGVYGKIDYETNKEDESEYKHYFKFWTFSALNEWWLASGDFDENNFTNGVSTNVFSLSSWNYTTGEPAGVGLPVRCIRDK